MSRILHISDPHFGTEQHAVPEALLAFAKAHSPDLILLSGDITQRARRSQFRAAGNYLRQFSAPVLTVPGNHDIPLINLLGRWLNPYGNYRRAFGDDLEPEFENEHLLLVAVNSSRPNRHKDGEVSAEQIARVSQCLRCASPDQLRIVMQHHPVRAVEESDLSNLLIGRQQAVPAWVDAGLDILLAGHIHLPYVRGLSGTKDRSAWTAQAGTSLSRRVRSDIPNSINLIEHNVLAGQHICRLERWDFDWKKQHFAQVNIEDLPLSR